MEIDLARNPKYEDRVGRSMSISETLMIRDSPLDLCTHVQFDLTPYFARSLKQNLTNTSTTRLHHHPRRAL